MKQNNLLLSSYAAKKREIVSKNASLNSNNVENVNDIFVNEDL